MRKFTLLLAILLSLQVVSYAQGGAMEFKGIPIQGNSEEFLSHLLADGFTLLDKGSHEMLLEGTFMDKTCKVKVLSTVKTDQVWKVNVYLPESVLPMEDFKHLSTQFQTQYGQPADKMEIPGLEALIFKTTNGTIGVEIRKEETIIIGFEDKKNTELMTEERK